MSPITTAELELVTQATKWNGDNDWGLVEHGRVLE